MTVRRMIAEPRSPNVTFACKKSSNARSGSIKRRWNEFVMPLFGCIRRGRGVRDYKVISNRPRGHSTLNCRKRHAADLVSAYGGLRDTPAYHDAETSVGEKSRKDFYRKRGFAYRAAVAQKRLLHRQAVLLSEHTQ